jgi:hypothetical protein
MLSKPHWHTQHYALVKTITKASRINAVIQVIPGEKKTGLQKNLETDGSMNCYY